MVNALDLARSLLIDGLLIGGVGLVIMFGGRAWAAAIEDGAETLRLEKRVRAMWRISNGLQLRIDRRTGDVSAEDAKLSYLKSQHSIIRRRIQAIQQEPHQLVRLVGKEHVGQIVYKGELINTMVVHAAQQREVHSGFDMSWARGQPVEIYAGNLEEARALVHAAYPRALGFRLISLTLHDADEVRARPAMLETLQDRLKEEADVAC